MALEENSQIARESLHDLAGFVAVAQARSFTKAAAQLGVSPSALSHAMPKRRAQSSGNRRRPAKTIKFLENDGDFVAMTKRCSKCRGFSPWEDGLTSRRRLGKRD